jgi:hypothetical protein
MCAFGRITRVVFRGRGCWGIGCCIERSGWTTESAVLMEGQQLSILDDGKLLSRKSAQLKRMIMVNQAVVHSLKIGLTSVPKRIGLLRKAHAAK